MREEEHNRLRSLASMARVLNRPHPLPRLLELAAEEACLAMPAASIVEPQREMWAITPAVTSPEARAPAALQRW